MITILKYLIYFCLFSVLLGPLGSLPIDLPNINIYSTDLFVGLILIFWIVNYKLLFKTIKSDPIFRYFLLFVGIAVTSWILSPINLSSQEKIISGLYLVRFTAYFSIYLSVKHLIDTREITSQSILKGLLGVGIVLSLIGWVQYFLYPDLRNLYYLGWDPHYKRIFATYFDPNFFGLIVVLTLILHIFSLYKSPHVVFSWLTRLFIFITLMFTYSRSSYFSLIAAMLALSIFLKRLWLTGAVFLILIISALLLPRPRGEGIRLERVVSIQDRIESWRLGIRIFAKYPILGAGFNTLRYAKKQFGTKDVDWLTNHSGAGIENSFLFIAATTGILGLASILILMYQIFRSSGLLGKITLIAIITHGLFLNSFFFPFAMLWMWSIIGINLKPQMSKLKSKS